VHYHGVLYCRELCMMNASLVRQHVVLSGVSCRMFMSRWISVWLGSLWAVPVVLHHAVVIWCQRVNMREDRHERCGSVIAHASCYVRCGRGRSRHRKNCVAVCVATVRSGS
jgi:hypothetical protein